MNLGLIAMCSTVMPLGMETQCSNNNNNLYSSYRNCYGFLK